MSKEHRPLHQIQKEIAAVHAEMDQLQRKLDALNDEAKELAYAAAEAAGLEIR